MDQPKIKAKTLYIVRTAKAWLSKMQAQNLSQLKENNKQYPLAMETLFNGQVFHQVRETSIYLN